MPHYQLQRVNGPILQPEPAHAWESGAVFNPGTVREGNGVHVLYRAVEGENCSAIGYARLNADGQVLERRPEPVITREMPYEARGCEDPRIVPFGNTCYIFYTGYDGKYPERGENARVVMAQTDDFIRYRKLGLVGPDMQDKDAMIFPEKIDGKVAFLHRIEPNIQLAMFDDLEHLLHPEPGYWEHHLEHLDSYTVMRREFEWESLKIGAGPPPIRTDAGWLLIYHGKDKRMVYRTGAALLDEKNPYRVIARLPYPILEPERVYERVGDVNNVVFPEGAAVFEDELQIYYGAADKVVALAVGSLSELIDVLWTHRVR